ncbi:unnamed protein product [Mycetohabitans rhizoxinica HKI 454]|uniref:Uncharacterized protein n=1 Tax=Mycetohabitans rhizoxinica (strain DSM 19002 / CIP 109453 / HKI 454) TaxID=882378 RepID=E5ARS7_MYCRK|nr:unnamed protein product [Mycetohabitans rhizoxinica HKI 454]
MRLRLQYVPAGEHAHDETLRRIQQHLAARRRMDVVLRQVKQVYDDPRVNFV